MVPSGERGDRAVPRQVVGRIVGGADRLHAELAQDAVRAQLVGGEQRVGLLPDARRAALVQQFVDAEVAFQFQVRPVVQRIAQRGGTVRAQARNFSYGGASPVQWLSGTPLARMARHL